MILDDAYSPRVFFSNSHDGSSRFVISFAPLRLKCLSYMKIMGGESYHFAVRHTPIANHKLRIAEGFVRQNMQAITDLRQLANDSVSKIFNTVEVRSLFEQILEIPTGKKTRTHYGDLEILYSCYYAEDTARYMGTGYGIILAVARYVTHF